MYLLKYGIYVFVILLVIHSIMYYYNIDLFEIIMKPKASSLDDNINIEENIKDLQLSLKELEELS